MNEFIRIATISVPLLLEGLLATIEISVLAILISIVLGLAIAYLRISKLKICRTIASIYIKIFRCIPFMVEVYLAYYGLPLLGFNVSAFSTGVLILGLYTAAYIAVILESGLKSLPKGQSEAAYAIGMSRQKTLFRILLPQTISVIIPPITGQFLQTVKDSSILSIITVAEMTMMTKKAIGITFSPLFVYICAGVFYWIINIVIEASAGFIERKNRQISI